MSRPATSRLKVNAPLGRMPVLQFCSPSELRIDPAYQRDISSGPSQTLIRRIAQFWNWDLCQPLVVARRSDLTERLFVIDGQHRLEAARLRGDIPQLPCVIVDFANTADEAASFVHLNQQRRPLSKLDVFKAAVASEDPEATAILAAIAESGLSVAPHVNYISWQPGMVANIGGIESAWRQHGPKVAKLAMRVLALVYPGERLQLAGTLYSGIVAICASEPDMDDETFCRLLAMLRGHTQREWRAAAMRARADNPNLRSTQAAGAAMMAIWRPMSKLPAEPEQPPPSTAEVIDLPAAQRDTSRWCDQCDMKVPLRDAVLCKSRFCTLRPKLAKTG